jgi:nucleotide-binding universal stress UspA family protein
MPIRTILCPVDLFPASEEAARYAVSFAARVGAKEVHLVHVHQPPAPPFAMDASVASSSDELRRLASRKLEELAKRYSVHDVTVTPHLEEGVPYQRIVDAVDRLGADLVVMGTHGRGGLPHLLLGSVAERVVRLSKVPVCTVPLRAASARTTPGATASAEH